MTERQFAYGADSVSTDDGEVCPCPASAVGYSPQNGELTEIAETYDSEVETILSEVPPEHEGVVPESIAREAWIKAVTEYRTSEFCDTAVLEEARIVQSELGW
jgi:hypothetical protein